MAVCCSFLPSLGFSTLRLRPSVRLEIMFGGKQYFGGSHLQSTRHVGQVSLAVSLDCRGIGRLQRCINVGREWLPAR